jgi:hypothetical protein
MSIAPENQAMREAIIRIVNTQFILGSERVLFMDPDGELRDVLYPSEGSSAIRAKRAELLSRGVLGAVIHLAIDGYSSVGQVAMVEVIGDPEPYTVLSWLNPSVWSDTRPDAVRRWQEIWGEEEAKEE